MENATPGYVKYTYNQNDVKQDIGRTRRGESDKLKQLEYDALGRLTSVCEITALTGYAHVDRRIRYNGYMTTYAYTVNGSGTINHNSYARAFRFDADPRLYLRPSRQDDFRAKPGEWNHNLHLRFRLGWAPALEPTTAIW